jgi:hypothetical protein
MRLNKYINILLVVVISAALLVLWINGLNWVYAKILNFITNIFLFFSSNTSLSVEDRSGEIYFVVDTVIEGKKGTYPQKAGLIILPFVMMLTWQILLFINIAWRKALRSTIENLSAFILVQVIYLLILTGYYESNADKFFFHLLIDSFYIIGLFLIVKDALRFKLIRLTGREEGSDK